jgi:hypothetical protein
MKLFPCTFHRKKPMLIMSNGSERGEFVPLGHIFSKTRRIHDGIQVLKAYYPHEENWSPHHKVSEAAQRAQVDFAWDYEYEDYHPFNLNVPGGDCRKQFEQIKTFGADLHLTVTMDLSLSDREIEKVVGSLRPYGRIFLRINHECNGNWFRFNKYHSYKEVSDFFVRCHRIVKANSSNIFTVFSLSGDFFAQEKVVNDLFLRLAPDEMRESLELADYWSLDRYSSLHYGWPFEETVTPESKNTYFKGTAEDWWRLIEECYLSMIWHNGLKMKPLFINEFNADSNVDGLDAQAAIVGSVYDRLVRGDFAWLAGITFYQFRDLGGLGLEKGDLREYRENPVLPVYRDAIDKIHYHIKIEDWQEWPQQEYFFSWQNSDSIRGLCIRETGDQNRFINELPVPLFLVLENQQWVRLLPKQVCDLSGQSQVFLLVPPTVDANGVVKYSFKVREIKQALSRMMAVKSEVCN